MYKALVFCGCFVVVFTAGCWLYIRLPVYDKQLLCVDDLEKVGIGAKNVIVTERNGVFTINKSDGTSIIYQKTAFERCVIMQSD